MPTLATEPPSGGVETFLDSSLPLIRLRPKNVVIASFLAFQIAGLGTTAAVPIEHVTYRTSEWTRAGLTASDSERAQSKPAEAQEVHVEPASARRDSAESIRLLRDISGLTWEQLSRIFAVSRRSVHLWASGKSLNAPHAELLGRVLGLVMQLPGDTPEQRRAALLSPTETGVSLFDQLRMDRANALALDKPAFSFVAEEAREVGRG